MLLPSHSKFIAALFLLRSILATESTPSTQTRDLRQPKNPDKQQNRNVNGICKFRVINHITDKLPQQCLKNKWNGTGEKAPSGVGWMEDKLRGNITATVLNITSRVIKEVIHEVPLNTAIEAAQTLESVPGLSEDQSTFLSFEEWKKQTLEKAEQKEYNHGQKKFADTRRQESDIHQKKIDTLEEIDLQISSFNHDAEKTVMTEKRKVENEAKVLHNDKRKESYRSKDAGKTCKERFSYSSFDAGATVLKTHPGAKNAKNILIENKDSYMLTECSVKNKFIIIELSEDIWIDTVVLANYEFFSSMIRTFRVSVSDRYPVKMDKWKEVGTYEARNSRDIQAFLVENPQIWARYVRFEFLDHYGTEYYCPLSLVRVHGTRMLESWKETEAAGEDEDTDESLSFEEANRTIGEKLSEATGDAGDAGVADSEAIQESSTKDPPKSSSDHLTVDKTSWKDPGFYIFSAGHSPPSDGICPVDDLNSRQIIVEIIETITVNSTKESTSKENSSLLSELGTESLSSLKNSVTNMILGVLNQSSSSALSAADSLALSNSEISRHSYASQGKPPSPTNNSNQNTSSSSTVPKDKLSTQTTSSSSALPTIQESFFKAVSRRLTLLESNSTLSLTYISEATSHLHQAFAALSRNITNAQLIKTTIFLDAINSTVFSELRGFRQQYNEIWQSTVISLESQREESHRQTLAVSERLNILAQEVVWQRRMSMVQSVLLLLCLGIVIFSRVSTSSDQFFLRQRSRKVSAYSRRFNDIFLSEPASPVPWPDTPNLTSTCSLNSPRNPILSHLQDGYKSPYPAHLHESMIHSCSRSPATGYFDQMTNSPIYFPDRDLTPVERISMYHSQSNSRIQTPSSLMQSHEFRHTKSSPLVQTSTDSPETYHQTEENHEKPLVDLQNSTFRKPISLRLPELDISHNDMEETLTPYQRRRGSLLQRRSLQNLRAGKKPSSLTEGSRSPLRLTSSVFNYIYMLTSSVSTPVATTSGSRVAAKDASMQQTHYIEEASPSFTSLTPDHEPDGILSLDIQTQTQPLSQSEPPEQTILGNAVTKESEKITNQSINTTKPLPALPKS